LQCANDPPAFGGGVYQPVSLLYADKPYIIATQQNGSAPNAFGVVRRRPLLLVFECTAMLNLGTVVTLYMLYVAHAAGMAHLNRVK
jgi:hypothetical protein